MYFGFQRNIIKAKERNVPADDLAPAFSIRQTQLTDFNTGRVQKFIDGIGDGLLFFFATDNF
ncbi:MAG: hypothetical protein IPP99_16330 [Chitinophagaceae bacterium]|nr:hypothetical protein [Chitinophagaceae bacterium]